MRSITDQMSLLFQTSMDGLSKRQVSYLHALVEGETALSSRRVIRAYRLGTSATVRRSPQALIQKEALDDFGSELIFLNPLFRYWLHHDYFRVKRPLVH